jgi:hypothetical protein
MPNLTLKLNITAIHNPKYLLQLQFSMIDFGVYVHDFDGTDDSYTIWGKDHNIYLPDDIDTINFDYDFNDKLILPGIWNLSILDDDSFLDELIFENHSSLMYDNQFPVNVDIKKPINALLFKKNEGESFVFPLVIMHEPFFSGIVDTKSLSFDDTTKIFNFTCSPDIALLKRTDITNVHLTAPLALEIPDTTMLLKDILYYLLQIAFPNLTRDNIIIEHEFVFFGSTNALTDLDFQEFTIHEISFNPRTIAGYLNITSAHDLLKAICFSLFSTLTVTHNKAIFASINKSFKTANTINVSRSISSFKKEVSFESLSWIKITTVINNYPYPIGTQSILTNGLDKNIIFGTGHVNSSCPIIVDKFIIYYIAFGKKNSDPSSIRRRFHQLIAELWFDYLNIFTSGRIYKFTIEGTDFDYSNSIGHTNNGNDRLYSPVSIHYNIVDDCTEVEAVRN